MTGNDLRNNSLYLGDRFLIFAKREEKKSRGSVKAYQCIIKLFTFILFIKLLYLGTMYTVGHVYYINSNLYHYH